jgi:hypothetical protein
MTERKSLPLAREASNRGAAKEEDITTAVSRTHGALRLLGHVRGPREHREAILSSVLRRLLEAAAAVEEELRRLAA